MGYALDSTTHYLKCMGMEDYPRNLPEFRDRFSTEEACIAYLTALRWPDGFKCPKCGGSSGWKMSRGLFLCQECRNQISVTSGTIFHQTRKPLRVWFEAMWHVMRRTSAANDRENGAVVQITRCSWPSRSRMILFLREKRKASAGSDFLAFLMLPPILCGLSLQKTSHREAKCAQMAGWDTNRLSLMGTNTL